MAFSLRFSVFHSDLNDFLSPRSVINQNGMPFSAISTLTRLGRPLGGGGTARSFAKGKRSGFPNAVTFEFKEVFSTLPPRSARACLGPQQPPQWGLRYRFLAYPCIGLRADSADPLIGTRRDPQYGRVDCDRP
jgi:hypothetical protein